jgi:hypothetical protein
MDPRIKAIVRERQRQLAEVRRRGHLQRQVARLRLTTAELAIRPRRRA